MHSRNLLSYTTFSLRCTVDKHVTEIEFLVVPTRGVCMLKQKTYCDGEVHATFPDSVGMVLYLLVVNTRDVNSSE